MATFVIVSYLYLKFIHQRGNVLDLKYCNVERSTSVIYVLDTSTCIMHAYIIIEN